MTARQWQAVQLIARRGKVSACEMAAAHGMRSQDAGRTLASLERHGYVRFDVADGRAGYVAA